MILFSTGLGRLAAYQGGLIHPGFGRTVKIPKIRLLTILSKIKILIGMVFASRACARNLLFDWHFRVPKFIFDIFLIFGYFSVYFARIRRYILWQLRN